MPAAARTGIRVFYAVVFAIFYGIFTMLATGGGHGNWVWAEMFMSVDFWGGYFVLIAILSANLNTSKDRLLLGAIAAGHFAISAAMISYHLIYNSRHYERISTGGLAFFAAMHFLPTIFCLIVIAKSAYIGSEDELPPDDEAITTIDLNE